jgi:hypothetical protein
MKKSGFSGLIAVIALFLVSCDKNNGVPESSGKLIPVSIRSLRVAAEGTETMMRSASQREGGMVSAPIGEGMLLEMKMECEKSPLRSVGDGATYSLADNAKFRVIAVRHDNSRYVSHGDFTVTVGPAELHSAEPFLIREGAQYDFICISYNDEDLPPTTGYSPGVALPALAVDNYSKTNLLWWKSDTPTPIIDSEEDTHLDITLRQKLAKVQVVLDCSYNEWKITEIDASGNITMGAVVNGSMNLITGVIGSASGDHILTWPDELAENSTQQVSDVFYAIPKSVSVTIPAEAITIDGNSYRTKIPVTGGTGTFATALEGGGNYKLYVRLKTPRWAGSNVYWVETSADNGERGYATGYLTFDTEENTVNQGYQGVCFKFGSLVGISPALTGTTGTEEERRAFSPATPVYIPTYVAGGTSTWRSPTVSPYTSAGWTSVATNNTDDDSTIPYVDGRSAFNGSPHGLNNTFVIDHNDPAEMWTNKRGDICQYLGATDANLKGYRLPTGTELDWGTGGNRWVETTNANGDRFQYAAAYPNGRADFLSVAQSASFDTNQNTNGVGKKLCFMENLVMGNVTLPASGYRFKESGRLDFVGDCAYYMSGSIRNSTEVYNIAFTRSTWYAYIDSYKRSSALSVRCVKD